MWRKQQEGGKEAGDRDGRLVSRVHIWGHQAEEPKLYSLDEDIYPVSPFPGKLLLEQISNPRRKWRYGRGTRNCCPMKGDLTKCPGSETLPLPSVTMCSLGGDHAVPSVLQPSLTHEGGTSQKAKPSPSPGKGSLLPHIPSLLPHIPSLRSAKNTPDCSSLHFPPCQGPHRECRLPLEVSMALHMLYTLLQNIISSTPLSQQS